MLNTTLHLLINDGLWLLVALGWLFLLSTGLEADKPLSGGIPGHVEPGEAHHTMREGLAGRAGTAGAWLGFGLAVLSLPAILWWLFAIHPR